jgi:hypothetical protein
VLAFIRTHRNAAEEIRVVPVSGGESQRLPGDFHDTQWLTWSRGGMDLLTFTRREGKPASWWRVPLAGAVAMPMTALSGNANSANLSPARDQLAYAERSVDTNIWRFELDTRQGRGSFSRLIASTRQDHSPEISPDGATATALAPGRLRRFWELRPARPDGPLTVLTSLSIRQSRARLTYILSAGKEDLSAV